MRAFGRAIDPYFVNNTVAGGQANLTLIVQFTMDDKVSSTYHILLMIIIAPRRAPKGGASVVVGACFAPAMGFR
jgi:hypothetical protein